MQSDNQETTIKEINDELTTHRKEISVLRKRILDLETECIGLLLQKESYEERVRISRLKKGLLADGTSEE
jgi:predicted  nucleic acid-binding Zn-ribbon protein